MNMDKMIACAKDVIAIFAGALMILATQLDQNGFSHVAWASVASAAVGGLIAWSRIGTGGFRKE